MTGTHDHSDLAAYGLGKLDHDESAAVAEHLRTCSRARAEYGELTEVGAMLDEVPPEMFLDGDPEADQPDSFGRDRAVHRIRAEERKASQQWRGRLAAAAAVLLVIGGAVGVVTQRLAAPAPIVVAAPADPAGRLVSARTGSVAAAAVITPAPGWVRVAVTAQGLPPGRPCTITVQSRSGTEVTAATWIPGSGDRAAATVNGSASVAPEDVTALAIRDAASGEPLVSIPV